MTAADALSRADLAESAVSSRLMFDSFVIVDWSAANMPRVGRDSIWICRRCGDHETLVNPPTRHAAKALIAEWLTAAQCE